MGIDVIIQAQTETSMAPEVNVDRPARKIRLCIVMGSHWAAQMGGAQYQAKCLLDALSVLEHVPSATIGTHEPDSRNVLLRQEAARRQKSGGQLPTAAKSFATHHVP
jgi:hypothetical protein